MMKSMRPPRTTLSQKAQAAMMIAAIVQGIQMAEGRHHRASTPPRLKIITVGWSNGNADGPLDGTNLLLDESSAVSVCVELSEPACPAGHLIPGRKKSGERPADSLAR